MIPCNEGETIRGKALIVCFKTVNLHLPGWNGGNLKNPRIIYAMSKT
jgi:hypothetical protein